MEYKLLNTIIYFFKKIVNFGKVESNIRVNNKDIFYSKKIRCAKESSVNIKSKLSKQYDINVTGKNNLFETDDNFIVDDMHISIKGNNNTVKIGKNFKGKCFNVYIWGDNNLLEIGENGFVAESLEIYNTQNCQNGSIQIAKDVAFAKSTICLYDNNSFIKIGEDCIFAINTTIHAADGHAVYEEEKLCNKGIGTEIGNHCWFGFNSSILKNSSIGNNCIVAAGAMVSGKFEENNCVLGGLPAKIIKRNVNWTRKTVNEIENNSSNIIN